MRTGNEEFSMHEEFATHRLNHAVDVQTLQRRIDRLSLALVIFVALFLACLALLAGWSWRQSRALNNTKDDILFGRFIHYDYDSDDYVAPVVNNIQFFHNGYSIQFDRVAYTNAGLVLSGEMGNPNQFRIKHLTLTFAARPYPEKIRDKWINGERNLVGWSPDWDLGRTKIDVGDLEPGQTAKFNLTVPGVKQTQDPARIAVLFSGEAYEYLPRR